MKDRDPMEDAPELAKALLRHFGVRLRDIERAHHYAFARAHPHQHFGAVGDEYDRLYWAKVVMHLERAYYARQRTLRARELAVLRRRLTHPDPRAESRKHRKNP